MMLQENEFMDFTSHVRRAWKRFCVFKYYRNNHFVPFDTSFRRNNRSFCTQDERSHYDFVQCVDNSLLGMTIISTARLLDKKEGSTQDNLI